MVECEIERLKMDQETEYENEIVKCISKRIITDTNIMIRLPRIVITNNVVTGVRKKRYNGKHKIKDQW